MTSHTVQKWTKWFLGVVYVHLVWELGAYDRYRTAWGGRLQSLYQVSGESFVIVSNVNLVRG
jgi:hypothetical protein